MMNADVTAENRPDCIRPCGEYQIPRRYSKPTPGTQVDTHENKGGVEVFIVFLLEVPIVFIHFSLELVVELRSGIEPRSSDPQHGLQGVTEGLFQSFIVQPEIVWSWFNGYLRLFI